MGKRAGATGLDHMGMVKSPGDRRFWSLQFGLPKMGTDVAVVKTGLGSHLGELPSHFRLPISVLGLGPVHGCDSFFFFFPHGMGWTLQIEDWSVCTVSCASGTSGRSRVAGAPGLGARAGNVAESPEGFLGVGFFSGGGGGVFFSVLFLGSVFALGGGCSKGNWKLGGAKGYPTNRKEAELWDHVLLSFLEESAVKQMVDMSLLRDPFHWLV